MTKVRSICFVIALILSLFPEQIAVADSDSMDGISLVASSQSGVELIGQISSDTLQTHVAEVDGQLFTEVTLEGWATSNMPGEPSLPFSTAMIGVPFGFDLSLEIIPGPSKPIYLDAPVLPGTTQIFQQNLNLEQALEPLQSDFDFVVKPDSHIYASDSPYPKALAEIVSDGVVRDQRIASIALYPIQYNPDSQTLQVFESIFVRVTFSGKMVLNESGKDAFANPFDTLLSNSLLNYESAKNWRLFAGQAVLYDQGFQDNLMTAESINAWQPPTPSWRILTEGSGLFSLDYDDLAAVGVLLANPSPKYFSLYRQGVELAIEVMGEEDDTFDLQDEILFYAPEFQSKYTRFDAFWLTISDAPGLRVTPRTDTPPEGDVVTAYNQEYRHENNLYYRSILKGIDDFERFVGEYIMATGGNSSQISLPFETNLLGVGSAELSLRVYGWNYSNTLNPDHHLKVYLNDNIIGEEYWDGDNWLELTWDVTSHLNEGENTLRLQLPNDLGMGTEIVFLDWFIVNYPRATRALNNQLEYSYQLAGDWIFYLEDFSTNDRSDLRIWDVSNAVNLVEISDYEIITEGSNDFTLTFDDEILTEKHYLAIDLREANQVSSVEADNASDLLNPAFPPQMVIISHAEFLTEAERLADYRRSVGIEALAVDVQDIYDEFAYGVVDPQAIKDYLGFALDNWN
ncbi:MAG TPA: C25 family peptidase propeptide domain-containing protein, partial [Cyclobacteriaceae bacterium]|nr:C25 family peptidase propeptide domain-containing protein [Cyclobacteriaceae bacterium]